MRIEPVLLLEFMAQFYGYGNLASDLWFVGMEEGGGKTLEEVVLHLETWDSRGRRLVEDLREFQLEKNPDNPLFSDPPSLQKTWKRLALVELALRGAPDPPSAVKDHQRERLGRLEGSHALLELLPLPKPSRRADDWHYGDWTGMPVLQDHATYQRRIGPKRIERLVALVAEHRPRLLVCYGLSFQPYWETLGLVNPGRLHFGQKNLRVDLTRGDSTSVITICHPTDWRPQDDYFLEVGAFLRRELGSSTTTKGTT